MLSKLTQTFGWSAMVLSVLAFAVSANASVIATLGDTTTMPTSWASTPDIGTSTPTDTSLTFAGGSALEQTITVGSSALTLDKLAFAVSLSNASSATMTLSIYAVADPLAAGFTRGTNLLPGGGSFTYSNNTGSTVRGILTLDLTGTDEITLAANTSYVIDLKRNSTSPTFNPGFYYFTGSDNASSAYAGGALFYNQQFSNVGGTNGADAAFALYTIPEPASLALLGLGGLLMVPRHRRRA